MGHSKESLASSNTIRFLAHRARGVGLFQPYIQWWASGVLYSYTFRCVVQYVLVRFRTLFCYDSTNLAYVYTQHCEMRSFAPALGCSGQTFMMGELLLDKSHKIPFRLRRMLLETS